MSQKSPEKDFGPIADDYAFFERYATEAEADARAYAERLQRIVPVDRTVRMLDFGCGSGTFTARFLKQIGWPADRLRLLLVEPVDAARREAVARLTGMTVMPILDMPALPISGLAKSFDVVLANHSLYYVPDLQDQLSRLTGALSTGGVFTTAIASRANALIEFWVQGFGLLGEEVPYHTAEDVAAALVELGVAYETEQVAYDLTFADTEENRMRIIRFLLADHLKRMPQPPLLELFDKYSRSGRIAIRTASEHFTVCSAASE